MQVFDASSMIYAWDNYPFNQFPPLWKWMAIQTTNRALVMPSVALEEVNSIAPDCGKWLKKNKIRQLKENNAILTDAMRIRGLLGIVGDKYHAKGVGENDIIIIATARIYESELVSNEEQPTLPQILSKRRIPSVCSMQEVAVQCYQFIDYIKRSNEVFS